MACLPLHLQSCESWMVMKEYPDRKEKEKKKRRQLSSFSANLNQLLDQGNDVILDLEGNMDTKNI